MTLRAALWRAALWLPILAVGGASQGGEQPPTAIAAQTTTNEGGGGGGGGVEMTGDRLVQQQLSEAPKITDLVPGGGNAAAAVPAAGAAVPDAGPPAPPAPPAPPTATGAAAGDVAQVAETAEEGGDEDNDDDETVDPAQYYFYLHDKDSVVVEYEPPPEGTEDVPDFLYNAPPEQIRLVEFYAHWCPHCQEFRPKFNAFAKKMKAIAAEHNLQLGVYGVSCVPHRPVCRDYGLHAYPRVYLFLDGSSEGTEIHHSKLHPFQVLRTVGIEVGAGVEEAFDEEEEEQMNLQLQQQQQQQRHEHPGGDPDSGLEAPDFWIPRTKSQIYADAYLSFDFAMHNAIYVGRGPLSEKARIAFEDFMELLQKALPPTWRLQLMITEIVENMGLATTSEEGLLGIVDKYPPPRRAWSPSCTRGNPGGGYTCGLWQLFHIMTVGVVEWNDNNVAGKALSFYSTNEAAEILRAYIEQFFGCEVCRVNFLHEFDTCAFRRCERLVSLLGTKENWKELPLWLSEFHNGVNKRLMWERAERDGLSVTDEDSRAVEWPSRRECPGCWHPDGEFDPEKVFAFLQLMYWPGEIISSALVKEIRSGGKKAKKDDEKGVASWVYSLVGFILSAIVLSAASWFQKRRALVRTGKHKKEDDCPV